MEVEYNKVLHWEALGAAVPGESSTVPDTPWGEGIQLASVIQLLKGRADHVTDVRQLWLPIPRGTPVCRNT